MIKDALANAVEFKSEFQLENGSEWGFKISDDGVYCRDKDGEWQKLCAPLHVAAYTRDARSKSWGRQLIFWDRDGVEHRLVVSAAEICKAPADVIAQVADLGFVPPTASGGKQKLIEYIMSARPVARIWLVCQLGWQDSVFVLPDGAFGNESDLSIHFCQDGAKSEHAYKTSGTLAEWQERIAAPSVGNTRLILAISAAFAGPLLKILNEESGGFHFRGASSIGKSTLLKMAGSVWGRPDGFLRSWRATDNGLEGVAVQHCDTFLPLDELSQVDAKAAGRIAYMLANGVGKSRASRTGSARRVSTWRVMFVSTGEISLAQKISELGRGQRATAGQEVRILDVPADAELGFGVFDHIPGGGDAAAFADKLALDASQVYGTASREFLKTLCADIEKAAMTARSIQKQVVSEIVSADYDGQVRRAANRFALAAAAGELAAQFGVTGWKGGEATEAAKACFSDWLKARGGTGPSEIREGIAQVRHFLEQHGASRFQGWEKAAEFVPHRAGFVKIQYEGNMQYYVLTEVWKNEVCKGRDATAIARALIDLGILTPGKGGSPSISTTVPALKKSARLYCIQSKIFDTKLGS